MQKFGLALVLLLATVSGVSAQNGAMDARQQRLEERAKNVEERQQKAQEKREEVKQNIEERQQKRCDNINAKIDNRVNTFNQNKSTHVADYEKAVAKLKENNQKLKEKGYNTSKLEEDALIMHEKIVAYAKAYDAMISKLAATKQYECGKSDGQYKNALSAVKNDVQAVRTASQDIRNFYTGTVKQDIQAVRNQKPVKTTN